MYRHPTMYELESTAHTNMLRSQAARELRAREAIGHRPSLLARLVGWFGAAEPPQTAQPRQTRDATAPAHPATGGYGD